MDARPLNFNFVATHPTDWDPTSVNVTMNLRLDGCIVPSANSPEGARISYSHIVALDGLVDDATRRELLEFLTAAAPGEENPAAQVASEAGETFAGGSDEEKDVNGGGSGVFRLPEDRWERRTADMAGGQPTWGLKQSALEELAAGRPPAMVEVQSRLQALYPEYRIAHLPSDAIQKGPEMEQRGNAGGQLEEDEEGEDEERSGMAKRAKVDGTLQPPPQSADCSAFLANAAAAGDTFRFHVDADPTSFPPSPWTAAFGDYFNGEPGKPLLVTLLLYLNDTWERDWGGETLFLDAATDAGVFVRPRAGLAVLMDQDVLHRVSPPSGAAGGRMRLSLVWKLAFLAGGAAEGAATCLARPEWGLPASFGSAARVDAVKRRLAQERRQG